MVQPELNLGLPPVLSEQSPWPLHVALENVRRLHNYLESRMDKAGARVAASIVDDITEAMQPEVGTPNLRAVQS